MKKQIYITEEERGKCRKVADLRACQKKNSRNLSGEKRGLQKRRG